MKIKNIFLMAGILALSQMTVMPLGYAEYSQALEAALDAADPSVVDVPLTKTAQEPRAEGAGWTASLGTIQNASQALVDKHEALLREQNQLNVDLAALKGAITIQKDKNKAQLMALQERQQVVNAPLDLAALKQNIANTERSASSRKEEIAALQGRMRAAEGRLKLRQLKLSELDLEKKSLLIDQKVKVESALGGIKAENRKLQDVIDSNLAQEKMIRGKVDVLRQSAEPYVKAGGTVVKENAALKARLADLEREKALCLDRQTQLAARRKALEADKTIGRLLILNDRRQALEVEIKALEEKLAKPQTVFEQEDSPAAVMVREIASFESENKIAAEQIAELRENLAILEYKVNTLERYQTRNRI